MNLVYSRSPHDSLGSSVTASKFQSDSINFVIVVTIQKITEDDYRSGCRNVIHCHQQFKLLILLDSKNLRNKLLAHAFVAPGITVTKNPS